MPCNRMLNKAIASSYMAMEHVCLALKAYDKSTVNEERFAGLHFRGLHPMKFFHGKLSWFLTFEVLYNAIIRSLYIILKTAKG